MPNTTPTKKAKTEIPSIKFRRLCLNNIQNENENGKKKVRFSPKFIKLVRKYHIEGLKEKSRKTLYICQQDNSKRKTLMSRDFSQTEDLKKS